MASEGSVLILTIAHSFLSIAGLIIPLGLPYTFLSSSWAQSPKKGLKAEQEPNEDQGRAKESLFLSAVFFDLGVKEVQSGFKGGQLFFARFLGSTFVQQHSVPVQ
jgi:hypothetical protein